MGPVDVLELWPDYGHGPLWSRRQNDYVEPTELPLPAALAARLTEWGQRYEEDRLPLDGTGDPAYLAEGERLLAEVRAALGSRYRVVVTEPWWGEPAEDEPRPTA